ncbi:hypothetical protein BYT27DRAFT_6365377 [Phlegmacium glaucopus]|nr:hypothetical protein BYT27DRAFT_6365377 [Phlegmacium glaucopus]
MGAFHQYLFSLICTSLSISVATFIYHTLVLLIAHSETYSTPRIYQTSSITCAYLLTSLWTAIFVMSVTFTSLVLTKKWATTNNKMHIWMILISVLSLIEIMVMGFIAIISHKELRQLRYKQKWEWRNGGPVGNTAKWSHQPDHVRFNTIYCHD